MRKFLIGAFCIALAGLTLGVSTGQAQADSCWMHNGSLMRLAARGNQRAFWYESPRSGLQAAGVRRGTLLFNGYKNGNWYSGDAAVFSSACPGQPLNYYVEGPVASSQTRVTMRGSREVYKNCRPTGRWTEDTLVFTYSHQC